MHLDPGRPPPRCQSPRCLTRRQCTSPELKSQICRRLAKAHCILNTNIIKYHGMLCFPSDPCSNFGEFQISIFPWEIFPTSSRLFWMWAADSSWTWTPGGLMIVIMLVAQLCGIFHHPNNKELSHSNVLDCDKDYILMRSRIRCGWGRSSMMRSL